MNDLTTSPAERIRAFAAAVRAELADLPEDDVEELAGGLVGDLTDQAADNGGVIDLDDPAEYARELRAAAGLPERTDAAVPRVPWHVRFADWRAGIAVGIRRSPFGAWLLDLLVALRPVWWVLRGLGLYALTAWMLWPWDARSWDLLRIAYLGVLVLISVQWGRGRWLPWRWLRPVRTVISVLAVLALPGAIGYVITPHYVYEGDGGSTPPGLLLDGVQVGNLFAYDENGDPIEQVQLYTDRGTPVNLYGEQSRDMTEGWDDRGDGTVTVPLQDLQGSPIWNTYPLSNAPVDDTTGQVDPDRATQPVPPFARAPQRLPAPEPTRTPSATLLPTAAPETPAP
ncbi:hypothetical protein L2X99_14285 [Microbacterium sp. KUDC0406]|uniref:hypothetical protein n=1 Tax=Microbacterium sp. KUDC0406 TaxID=2909588 RepID=UPI001F1E25DC|nr:hypothetical protein [Microbacterium sp. KUDC0406]UJP09571.1 hypothetical protein L2X99_14285 [Microbacterium sp. KUDC0406]